MPGLPRAYLRMDPNIDQHPDPLGMVLLLCAAHRQPHRGRFKSMAVLTRLLGRARIAKLSERGDVVTLDDGVLYVDGWDEWQEGDLTVRDRMARLRARDRNNGVTAPLHDRTNASARASLSPTLTLETPEGGPGGTEETPAWLRAWLSVKLRMPTARQRDVLDSYLRVFDVSGSERASRIILGHPDDPLGAILADLRAFRDEAKDGAVAAEQEATARRRVQRRGFREGSVE